MDEGYGINLGINNLSSFARGWTETMMRLDQQDKAENMWRTEFLFKQDQEARRSMEADRRWKFELEKYEAGEDLRDIQESTAGLQLDVLNKQ